MGLGEHCLSTWPRSGSCELRSPARLWLIEGTAQRRQTGVAFSLATFFLAKQKKVACCRATPGGFVFDSCVHHRAPAASRRPFDRLMKQLAIRLSCQNTTAKSLVIRANGHSCRTIPTIYKSSNTRPGNSSASLIVERNCTASRPSMMRWS